MRQSVVAAALPLVLTAVTLAGVGRGSDQDVSALIEELQDDDLDVRMSAAETLVQIGEEAVPDLIRALRDDKKQVRFVAYVLGDIGQAAAPALVKALKDEDPMVRGSAAGALGQVGPAAKEVVPDLVKLLRDEVPMVRGLAAMALGRMGPAAEEATYRPVLRIAGGAPQVLSSLSDSLETSADDGTKYTGYDGRFGRFLVSHDSRQA